jgi:hypothetical protein
MNLLIALRSEILKTKRTAAFYSAILAGVFGPFASMLDLVFDGVPKEDRNIILQKIFTSKFQMTQFVMLPLFIILICTLLPQTEYKNNAWKQVLSSPQTKLNLYLARFLNIQLLILVFLGTNQLGMFVDALILHFKDPSLHIFQQPINGRDAVMTVVNSYIAMLAICSIQYWLGIRFKNFIAPIGIGFCLWFAGTLLVMQSNSGLVAFFPYSFHVYGNFPKYHPQFSIVGLTSFLYAIAFFLVGFLDFRRRRMTA